MHRSETMSSFFSSPIYVHRPYLNMLENSHAGGSTLRSQLNMSAKYSYTTHEARLFVRVVMRPSSLKFCPVLLPIFIRACSRSKGSHNGNDLVHVLPREIHRRRAACTNTPEYTHSRSVVSRKRSTHFCPYLSHRVDGERQQTLVHD